MVARVDHNKGQHRQAKAAEPESPLLTPNHARAILKFLSSSQVVGEEVPVCMECITLLRAIAFGAS